MQIDSGPDIFFKRINKINFLRTGYSPALISPKKQIPKLGPSVLYKRRNFRQKQQLPNLKIDQHVKLQKTTKYNSSLSPQKNDLKIRYKLCTSKNVVVFSRTQNPSGPPSNKLNLFGYDQYSPTYHKNTQIKIQEKSPRCQKQKQLDFNKTGVNFKMRKVSSSQSYRRKQISSNNNINKTFDPWINDEKQQDSDILFYKKQIQ